MKSFIKNNIKFIIVIVISVVSSSITTLATNYIFNSNEVSYDNTESGLHADSVQGAIDEVFQHATDYSEIKNTIGTGSLTTTSNTLIGGVNELNGKIPNVVNNLTSTSTTDCLSAAQGKALNSSIALKANQLVVEEKETAASLDIASGGTREILLNVAKNGYNAIGTVGHWGSGTGKFAIIEVYVKSNTLHIFVRNVTTQTASISYMKAFILYQKI